MKELRINQKSKHGVRTPTNITKAELDKIKYLLINHKRIPVNYWTTTPTNEERRVVWILDRQKPSVEPSYDFDEERLGITMDGKLIYGFDSGCSCPIAWSDCGDQVYTEKTWKALELDMSDLNKFDAFEVDDIRRLDKIVLATKENRF